MIVDLEALPLSDGSDDVRLQAEVQLDDPVAFRAGQVVVVAVAFAQAEGMCTVRELDAVQHLHAHELVDGPVDRGPANAGICAAQLLKQLFRGKRRSRLSEANQVFCDGPARLGPSFAELLERLVDPFLDVHSPVSALSPMIIVFPRRA